MERASSRAASAAAASSAFDLGRDLASACRGGQLPWLTLKQKEGRGKVWGGRGGFCDEATAYLALFANATLSVGFLLGCFGGLRNFHGHVVIGFIGGRIGWDSLGRSYFCHDMVVVHRNSRREVLPTCTVN